MKPWFERSFPQHTPHSDAPALFERLRQAPDRLTAAVRDLSTAVLTHRRGPGWSIQEHAGHLLDLEPLWDQRLDDYDRGAQVLRGADLNNRATYEARHNDRPITDVIEGFRSARARVLARLANMSGDDLDRRAIHPRLQQPMSVVDLSFFVAEHDDHHLETINELAEALRSTPVYALDLMNTVDAMVPRLLDIGDEAAAARSAPGKWSPKEIIGHLIDSASNNHQRFVRALFQDDLVFAGYQQDEWVAAQQYQEAPWTELVTLWATFNRHLARYMAAMPEGARLKPYARHNLDVLACQPVPATEPATLDYFMGDYVWHLHHHLRQIPSLAAPRG